MKKVLLTTTCVLCAVALSLSTAFAGGPDEPSGFVCESSFVQCNCGLVFGRKECLAGNYGSRCGGGSNHNCSQNHATCGG